MISWNLSLETCSVYKRTSYGEKAAVDMVSFLQAFLPLVELLKIYCVQSNIQEFVI